jgi:hypothetical protein
MPVVKIAGSMPSSRIMTGGKRFISSLRAPLSRTTGYTEIISPPMASAPVTQPKTGKRRRHSA